MPRHHQRHAEVLWVFLRLEGCVLSNSGRRNVFVALVNHELAPGARPALDALLPWTMRDAPAF